MPVRLPSWSLPFGLPPIFEMNLPEGVLRERLRLAFAKATGTFDEFDLLSVVGRSQIGRIRYTGDKAQLHEEVPFQSVRTDEKYRGSYETSVLKRFGQFANSTHINQDTEKLFTLIALNCALRNGDAHLKNFGIVYDDVQGEARLAPVYDLVTTSLYIAKDSLALTLNGTTEWPAAKERKRLGETRGGATPAKTRQTLERIGEAIRETAKEVQAYRTEHPEFAETGAEGQWGRPPACPCGRSPQVSNRSAGTTFPRE